MAKNLPAFTALLAMLRIAGWKVKVRPAIGGTTLGHRRCRDGVIVVTTVDPMAAGARNDEHCLIRIVLHEVGHDLVARQWGCSWLDGEVLAEAFSHWVVTGDLAAAVVVGQAFLRDRLDYYRNHYEETDENPSLHERWLRTMATSAKGKLVRKLVLAAKAHRA